ncbi:Gfo/Idh/MocA family protein [Lacipirellula sp.]|uniref:Gfo/Idh/MocA family protein n=1 Tax=Lacipirellula sp. TaxID=2691419 RepID=UPI003D13EE35
MNANRRDFLASSSKTLVGAAVFANSSLLTTRLHGNPSSAASGDRIRLGLIGVGNRGMQNLEELLKKTHCVELAAVCDVDQARMSDAQKLIEQRSGQRCATYNDYRRLLDDKSIDAVVISTPDHWHALATIDACRAGKDVYCEKPLTLTIAEGQAMVAAVRANKRIVQTGSQQRSDARFRRACELVRSGAIGKVHTVRVGISKVNFKGPEVPDGNPPPELNYDQWLGPAPKRPYNKNRVHYNFRFFWDYSGGQMTNWGAHHLDIAQWGLGKDGSGPVSALGKARYHQSKLFEVPEWSEVVYDYGDGTTLYCGHDQPSGTTFVGDRGTISVNRKELKTTPSDLELMPPSENFVELYRSDDHLDNWLQCIETRELPICDVAIGHRSATVCHLGNIAIQSGKEVRWDPVKEQVIGDDVVAQMVSRPYRAPWSLTSTR